MEFWFVVAGVQVLEGRCPVIPFADEGVVFGLVRERPGALGGDFAEGGVGATGELREESQISRE